MAMLNNQRVTIVISTISHSYWSYLHQLSDSELGHHLAPNPNQAILVAASDFSGFAASVGSEAAGDWLNR